MLFVLVNEKLAREVTVEVIAIDRIVVTIANNLRFCTLCGSSSILKLESAPSTLRMSSDQVPLFQAI